MPRTPGSSRWRRRMDTCGGDISRQTLSRRPRGTGGVRLTRFEAQAFPCRPGFASSADRLHGNGDASRRLRSAADSRDERRRGALVRWPRLPAAAPAERGGTDLDKALTGALAQCRLPNSSIVVLTDGGSDRGTTVIGRKIAANYARQWKDSAQHPRTNAFAVGDDANIPSAAPSRPTMTGFSSTPSLPSRWTRS